MTCLTCLFDADLLPTALSHESSQPSLSVCPQAQICFSSPSPPSLAPRKQTSLLHREGMFPRMQQIANGEGGKMSPCSLYHQLNGGGCGQLSVITSLRVFATIPVPVSVSNLPVTATIAMATSTGASSPLAQTSLPLLFSLFVVFSSFSVAVRKHLGQGN